MSAGRCIYSTADRWGTPLRVITFPNGVSCTLAALVRHTGWAESTLRSRMERTDNPARLLGSGLPGWRIAENEDWPALLAGIEQIEMPRQAQAGQAMLGWGYGAIDVERYLRRCAGASMVAASSRCAP